MKHVIWHLIGNAVKFTEREKIEFSVCPKGSGAEERENVHFEIRDTGIGIPAEKLGLIFHPFSQADPSLTRRYGGAGLGLAISKEMIEQLGGKLEVQSSSEGSVFSVTLPFVVAEQSERAPDTDHQKQRGRIPGGKGRILIVEDDPQVSLLLEMILLRGGYQVKMAEHGRRAMEILQQGAIDLILMDLKMPVMDGYEATRAIRQQEQWREIPIIALTAHARPEDKAQCLAVGMNDFLTKPIQTEQLYTVIEAHLSPV